MASIRKRKNSYQITVSNGVDTNGKRIERTMTYHPDPSLTPKQQEKALNKAVMEFEEKVKNENCFDGDRMTFSEFYEKWYNECGKIELEKTTLGVYDFNIRSKVLPSIGNLKLSAIKPLHLTTLYNALRQEGARMDSKQTGYASATIHKVHTAISSVLDKAVLWDVIEHNPCSKIKKPKGTKDTDNIDFFTDEEVLRFFSALDMEYNKPFKERKRKNNAGEEYTVASYQQKITIPMQFKVLFYLAIYSGARRGELISLQWDDIDFKNNTLNISKSTGYTNREMYLKGTKNKSSNRLISLPLSVMNMLRKYKKQYLEYQLQLGSEWAIDENGNRLNFLFIQSNGKQMHISTPLKKFHSILEMYNGTVSNECDKLPIIPFHGLRHTSATLLISQGVDIVTVSKRLGHADVSTTLNIYAHALRKMDNVASEKLEELLIREA